MGSVCIMRTGFWSSFQNPALLPITNLYQQELTTKAGLISGNLERGLQERSYPPELLRWAYLFIFRISVLPEGNSGLACGLRLSENISAGIQVDYFHDKAAGEYKNIHSVACEAGLLFTPKENITVGVHVFNPLPAH